MTDRKQGEKPAEVLKRLEGATAIRKGRQYEDFEVGQEFDHHWGRTLNSGDNSLFTTLTLHFNPVYFNRERAAALGHPAIPLNPLLVFNTVLGLSVEDLSESAGPFLGIGKLKYGKTCYEGDTVSARSRVLAMRQTSRPGVGTVTWETAGFNQHGEEVIRFERTNIVVMRGGRLAL